MCIQWRQRHIRCRCVHIVIGCIDNVLVSVVFDIVAELRIFFIQFRRIRLWLR